MKPRCKILIIAGSDSSGGAGIQADIKTVTSLGGYAMTAITAVTSQNTTGVKSVSRIKSDEVKKQIESAKTGFTKEMTETIDSEGELTDMLRGVDVVDKDDKKNESIKNSSAWPIPLNEKSDNNLKSEEELPKDDKEINTEEDTKKPVA